MKIDINNKQKFNKTDIINKQKLYKIHKFILTNNEV